ncbi:phosphoglycerate dehydrogenase [Garciella nitratireducens]|uniref:D-3-phosphoglycerate dehydrogenase n=1 Tax=Garciella nitratireducens DSM 15102 TaxID=1121911 RepID=A0A1T4NS34_9FIRM|nr:phosphoglycerate dehydrogenase [Garciella nitratireducens]SJZ81915.1 D-3-phosphoglycerate dehydrogenase [Garciella nitratireducens DSM 15102]
MIKILVSDPISEVGLKSLLDAEDIQVDIKTDLNSQELKSIIGEYQGLLVRSQTKVTKEIIEAGKHLLVIGRAGVGVDNIDIKAATEHGIAVINAPDGNTISACEHTLAMLLSMSRWIPQAHNDLTQKQWNRKKYVGVELNNKVLGIIGLGRIGLEVAKRAKAFNMILIGYDPFTTEEQAQKNGIQLKSLEEVLRQADFLTVHTPLTKETKYMIDDKQFSLMKKGIRIVNCARGGIIREEALIKALNEGIVEAATIDVFEKEPPLDSPLLDHPKVITTPHLGASTKEAQLNVAIDVAKEVYHYLAGVPYKNAINMPSLPSDILNHLKPYIPLAEKLGTFISSVIMGGIQKVEIIYSGDIIEEEIDYLTRNILKGILRQHMGITEVNDVNADVMAKRRNIEVVEIRSNKTHGFTNLITVKLTTNIEEKSISGTLLNGYGPRFVNFNGSTIDVIPEGHLIITEHIDKPGIIGKFGTLLGNAGINIGTMQVGRNKVGGTAIGIFGVDKEVEDHILDELIKVENVSNTYYVEL